MCERGPRPVPGHLLDHVRAQLRAAAMSPDYSGPTGYEQLARAVETAYTEGYADGWLRGYQEGHFKQEQRQRPAPEVSDG